MRVQLDVGLTACMGPEEYEVSILILEEGIHHAVCIMGEEPIRKLRDLCNKALGGEYICEKCGIRQDMNPKTEPEF